MVEEILEYFYMPIHSYQMQCRFVVTICGLNLAPRPRSVLTTTSFPSLAAKCSAVNFDVHQMASVLAPELMQCRGLASCSVDIGDLLQK